MPVIGPMSTDEHEEIKQDLGDVLYDALKPYIIPGLNLRFQREELGEGFFGVVLKAEHILNKKQYAAKFLKGNCIIITVVEE